MPLGQAVYELNPNGSLAEHCDVIPFLTIADAEYYNRSIPLRDNTLIRVNPKNQQETRYFDRDQ
jgi:hypothetical protein